LGQTNSQIQPDDGEFRIAMRAKFGRGTGTIATVVASTTTIEYRGLDNELV
jgi:hypothetical protein